MMPLPRELLWSTHNWEEPRYDGALLQEGLGGDAWRVAVASALLCRARKSQIVGPLRELFAKYSEPTLLSKADVDGDLALILHPCGLHRQRARQLQRMSAMWFSSAWDDARQLPGVGVYVADAIGLFCFGCTDLESNDKALLKYSPPHPIKKRGDGWYCDGVRFQSVIDAVEYRRATLA